MATAADSARLVREIDDYLAAAKHVREALVEVEGRLRRMQVLAAEGSNIRDVLPSFHDPAAVAGELAIRLKALRVAQLRARRQIVLMGRAEGLSLVELANFWGVSRQLVYRYARSSVDDHRSPEG